MDYKQPPKIVNVYQDPRDHKKSQLQEFLEKIRMLESSGGKDTDHETIKKGPQAGETAIGDYGLMPNTLKEMSNRYPSELINEMSKEQLQQKTSEDPEFAKTMAGTLTDYLKNQRGLSDEEAAAAWQAGHNLPVERLNLNSPRAKKFKVLNKP